MLGAVTRANPYVQLGVMQCWYLKIEKIYGPFITCNAELCIMRFVTRLDLVMIHLFPVDMC